MPGRYTRAHAPLSRAAEEANWFTLPSAVRVYRQFLQLDTDHDGMLTPQELARFDEEQHSLTPAFCGRLFEVVHTYEGRLDYKGYLDLVVALEGLRPAQNGLLIPREASLRYFWRVLDLHGRGAIGGLELHYFLRDITAGRFSGSTTLVLVTHGLALRVFLMRWFHLTVEEFLQVYNPNNAKPIILERDVENALCNLEQKTGKFEKEDMPSHWFDADATAPWRHTKSLYRIRQESIEQLSGLTSDMCGGCCGETCELFDDQSTKPQPFD